MDKVPEKKKGCANFSMAVLFVCLFFENLWNVLVGQHRQKSAEGFQLWLQSCYQTQKSVLLAADERHGKESHKTICL